MLVSNNKMTVAFARVIATDAWDMETLRRTGIQGTGKARIREMGAQLGYHFTA